MLLVLPFDRIIENNHLKLKTEEINRIEKRL